MHVSVLVHIHLYNIYIAMPVWQPFSTWKESGEENERDQGHDQAQTEGLWGHRLN